VKLHAVMLILDGRAAPTVPWPVWEISRYCSLHMSVIKVEGPKNQKWYQYHKYRYLPLQMVPFVTDEC